MSFYFNLDALREAASTHQDPKVLDGKSVAGALRDEVKEGVSLLREARGIVPRLVVVVVGEDPASKVYVRHKVRACEVVGIESRRILLPADTSQEVLQGTLKQLSADEDVNAILLQLPLPGHLNETRALDYLDPTKDVDGFHHVNLGRLMSWAGVIEPCTPRGVMTMLRARGVELRGKDAVVVGRSVIVGRPMAHMLLRADATVTICHRHTADLESKVRRAEILVVATGVPHLIKGDWIREGAVVVDIGISRRDGRLIGDVEFEKAKERASVITPVPGGVGPMTVATLMENTLRTTLLKHGLIIRDGELSEDGNGKH